MFSSRSSSSPRLRIHCDGRIFALQRHGGVHRATRNLLLGLLRRQDVETHTVLPAQVAGDVSWLPPQTVTRLPEDICLRPGRLFGGLANRWSERRRLDVWKRLDGGVFLATYYSTYSTLRVPQITVIHDMIYERFPDLTLTPRQEFHKREKQECIRAADVIVCPSRSASDDVQSLCDVRGKTVVTIPWGVEPEYQPSADTQQVGDFRRRITADAPYLLYVGGRDGTKNFTPLLMAYARWSGRHDIHLLAVGGGPFGNQENSILRALRLRELVHCVPAMPNNELIVAYSGAAACVMPSQYEGFGFPVLEAMACGTPVAASNVSSLPEVGGDVAVYFDPNDNDAMLAALTDVTDPGLRAGRVARGLVRAREFTWSKAVDRLVEVAREQGY